jgi:hypothetical protein
LGSTSDDNHSEHAIVIWDFIEEPRICDGANAWSLRENPGLFGFRSLTRRPSYIDEDMKISTTNCCRFSHLEFILEADARSVPDIYLHEMADTIEQLVAAGERFKLNETFQIGWMLTRVESYSASQLTLVEPDMKSFPIKWVSGITNTLRQKMMQVFMLDSIALRDQMNVPSILQSLIACTDYSGPNFFMSRSDPTNERDSGWFVGCRDTEHDHNDPQNLCCVSIYEAFLNQPRIQNFITFPKDVIVVMDRSTGLSMLNEHGTIEFVAGSFLDEWKKRSAAGSPLEF